MTIILFTIVCISLVILAAMSERPVSWARRLKRVRAGSAQSEWIAPEDVLKRVRGDYMESVHWLQDTAITQSGRERASRYLTGEMLSQFTEQIAFRDESLPLFEGVLRAGHTVQVHHFAETGDVCLVIDSQSQRRLATYTTASHERLHTQDMGQATLVYQMVYDRQADRWKVASFIQKLPAGWVLTDSTKPTWIEIHGDLHQTAGRDA